jgi:hypothetical protein
MGQKCLFSSVSKINFQPTTPSHKECRLGSVFVRQTRFSSDTLSGTEGVCQYSEKVPRSSACTEKLAMPSN